MKTKRILTAKYFPTSRLSRIYENGKWLYTTDENLDYFTSNDIAYYLKTSQNYKIK